MVDKKTLRKVYLEKRLTLTKEEYQLRNALLLKNLFDHIDFSKYNCVHSFLSIKDKKEVDTFQIIKQVRNANPSLEIAISKTVPKAELQHYLYNSTTKIKVNSWGIPEPVEGQQLEDISRIDLVLVPLLSFDKLGHRIGYGMGYYDRFLKKIPPAHKVGVSLSPPLDKILYSDELDVKMDSCVTPYKIYHF